MAVKWYQRHAAALATNDGTGIGALQADLERHYGLIGRHLITEICDLLATSGDSWRTHRVSVPLRAWLGRFCLPVARRAEFDESVELMLDLAAAVNSYAAGGLDPAPPFTAIEIDLDAQLVHLHWPPFAELLGTYQRDLARRLDESAAGEDVSTPCTGGAQGVDTPLEEPTHPPTRKSAKTRRGCAGGARKKGQEGRGKKKEGGGKSKSKSGEGGRSPAPKARRKKKKTAAQPPREGAGAVAGDDSPGAERGAAEGGYLALTGANSAAGLKSKPIRILFADECDEYPADVAGQGDPIKLAEARGAARRILAQAMERHRFDYAHATDPGERAERLSAVLANIDAAIENYGEEPVLAASLAADVSKALDPAAYLWQPQAAWYRQKEWRRGLPQCAAPGCPEKALYTWPGDPPVPLCGPHHKSADAAAATAPQTFCRGNGSQAPVSIADLGRQIMEGKNAENG